MRSVLDTNVVVSAFLWSGTPRRLLALISEKRLVALATPMMLEELLRVLRYSKFRARLKTVALRAEDVAAVYVGLVEMVAPAQLPDAGVPEDLTDNVFLEAALGGGADVIVSGDRHLLDLQRYQGIPIVTAAEFLELEARLTGTP